MVGNIADLVLWSLQDGYSSVQHYYTGKKICITSAYIKDLKKSDMIFRVRMTSHVTCSRLISTIKYINTHICMYAHVSICTHTCIYVCDLFFKNNKSNRKKLAVSSPRTRSYWNDEMMDKMDFTTILVYSVSLQFVCFIYFSFFLFIYFAADNAI